MARGDLDEAERNFRLLLQVASGANVVAALAAGAAGLARTA